MGGRGAGSSRSRSNSPVTQAIGVTQSVPMSIENALKANPNFLLGREFRTNCPRCVQAYELRRRGYNVEALPMPSKGNTISLGNECFTSREKITFHQTESAVKQKLRNAPVGSRYFIYVNWEGRGSMGHVFVAEKTSRDRVRYVDPQGGLSDVSGYFARGQKGEFGYFRVDNKPITTDAMTIAATVKAKER